MGVGYLDAGLALGAQETLAPAAVRPQVKDFNYYDAKVSWMVTKDEDSPNKITFEYLVYLSETPFVKSNTSSLRAIGGAIRRGAVTTDGYTFENPAAIIRSGNSAEGAEIIQAFENLEAGKTYYVAVVSRDRNKNVSAPAFIDFTTRQNLSPVLTSTVLEDLNMKLIMLDTESHIYFPYRSLTVMATSGVSKSLHFHEEWRSYAKGKSFMSPSFPRSLSETILSPSP